MMKKRVLLLCICLLSLHIVNAQSDKEYNIMNYEGTKDYFNYIPIYGRPNNTLVLKIYHAQEYMGDWMKTSEYPNKTYVATYNENGLLISVNSESENIKRIYTYSYSKLNNIIEYNINTGERKSSKSFPNPNYRGKRIVENDGKYFTVWFNCEKDDGDFVIHYSACAVDNNFYYFTRYNILYRFSPIDMIKEYGLSWRKHISESDPYNPTPKLLSKDNRLLRNANKSDRYGIGIDLSGHLRIEKYADVVSSNNFLIVNAKYYYEYTWTY